MPLWIKLIVWALLHGEPSPSLLSHGVIAMVERKLRQHTLLCHCFVLLRVRKDWLWKAAAEPSVCLLLLSVGS